MEDARTCKLVCGAGVRCWCGTSMCGVTEAARVCVGVRRGMLCAVGCAWACRPAKDGEAAVVLSTGCELGGGEWGGALGVVRVDGGRVRVVEVGWGGWETVVWMVGWGGWESWDEVEETGMRAGGRMGWRSVRGWELGGLGGGLPGEWGEVWGGGSWWWWREGARPKREGVLLRREAFSARLSARVCEDAERASDGSDGTEPESALPLSCAPCAGACGGGDAWAAPLPLRVSGESVGGRACAPLGECGGCAAAAAVAAAAFAAFFAAFAATRRASVVHMPCCAAAAAELAVSSRLHCSMLAMPASSTPREQITPACARRCGALEGQ